MGRYNRKYHGKIFIARKDSELDKDPQFEAKAGTGTMIISKIQ